MTCLHVIPATAFLAADTAMGRSRAIAAVVSPAALRALAARTSPSVSFACPRRRPFATMSAMFCLCVPRNRWSGRTQSGTSHLCSTQRPLGIGPECSSQEWRCAPFCARPPGTRTMTYPYPARPQVAPHHSQHVGVLLTRVQNRPAFTGHTHRQLTAQVQGAR